MQTGEGKTLTATLPAFLRALTGRGCHIVTVNDYLAARDAHEMGPIYERLGLTVGCIQNPMQTDERRESYAKDITYGTAKEIGFDFLRDRLRLGADTQGAYHRRNGFGNGSAGEARRAARPLFRARRRRGQHSHRRSTDSVDHRPHAAQHGLDRQSLALEPAGRSATGLATSTSSTSRIAVRPISPTTAAAKCS